VNGRERRDDRGPDHEASQPKVRHERGERQAPYEEPRPDVASRGEQDQRHDCELRAVRVVVCRGFGQADQLDHGNRAEQSSDDGHRDSAERQSGVAADESDHVSRIQELPFAHGRGLVEASNRHRDERSTAEQE